MLKKPQNCSISDFFNLTPKYFLPVRTALNWPSSAFYWPSTTKYWPVPPSIKQYRPILTQYPQEPTTSTALYWTSTTKCIYHNFILLLDFCTVYPRSSFLKSALKIEFLLSCCEDGAVLQTRQGSDHIRCPLHSPCGLTLFFTYDYDDGDNDDAYAQMMIRSTHFAA